MKRIFLFIGLVGILFLSSILWARWTEQPLASHGVARRVPLPEYGQTAFYWDLSEVCVNDKEELFLPNAKVDGPLLLDEYHFFSFDGRETHFLMHQTELIQSIDIPTAPDTYLKKCRISGTTLIMEESVGGPGHIAHFAEHPIKFFAFVEDATETVSAVWFLRRDSPPIKIDWEKKFLLLSMGNVTISPHSNTATQLPPVYNSGYLANNGCKNVERALLASVEHEYFYSELNAQKVREKSWKYCGFNPHEKNQTKNSSSPHLAYLHAPRDNSRQLLNLLDVHYMLLEEGFSSVPPPSLRSFCSQVNTFAHADLVINMHGAGNTNFMFMRPETVAIELFNEGFYWPCFKTIAGYCGLHYLDFTNKLPSGTEMDSKEADMTVDVEGLRKYVRYAKTLIGRPNHPLPDCMLRDVSPDNQPKFHEINWKHCTPPE